MRSRRTTQEIARLALTGRANMELDEYIQTELNKHKCITLDKLFEIINNYIPCSYIIAEFNNDKQIKLMTCYVNNDEYTNYPFDDFQLSHDGLMVSEVWFSMKDKELIDDNGDELVVDIFDSHDVECRYC